jgi:sporulation integral membrane protein YlbJ
LPALIASAVVIIFFLLLLRYRRSLPRHKRHLPTYLIALCAVLLTLSLVRFPQEAFNASVAGLEIWWHIVFPALLPFFIFSQILIGLGVVHAMGVFLEPVMRPLFNVPGAGSFVMAMGLASGYPIGAVLTSELRARELCNRVEAERLLSFTNTADPLFMFGAVAVGMFAYPAAGPVIAAAHYLSSLTVGLLMRFYKRSETGSPEPGPRRGRILARALAALVSAREQDGRPLGRLMGEAIVKSVETLMLIGGFIILLSVVIRILELIGVVAALSRGLGFLLELTGLSAALAPALVSGFFEIDLGCQFAGALATVAMDEKIIAAGMIIAWSGLSVHAQVASIISKTDIRIAPYIAARLLHALLAAVYSALLIGPAGMLLNKVAIPAFFSTVPSGSFSFWWSRTALMFNQFLWLCGFLIAAALFLSLFRAFKAAFFFSRR